MTTILISIQHAPPDAPDAIAVSELTCEPRRKPVEKGRARFVPDVEAARKFVPEGKRRFDPEPGDDPAVIEIWR